MQLAQRLLGLDAPELTLAAGTVQPLLSGEQLVEVSKLLLEVVMRQELVAYIVDLIRATRQHEAVLVGAGPRATQALLLSARAYALIQGRDFVTPDDIKAMAVPVLEHRLILRPEFEVEGLKISEVIERVFRGVAVPR